MYVCMYVYIYIYIYRNKNKYRCLKKHSYYASREQGASGRGEPPRPRGRPGRSGKASLWRLRHSGFGPRDSGDSLPRVASYMLCCNARCTANGGRAKTGGGINHARAFRHLFRTSPLHGLRTSPGPERPRPEPLLPTSKHERTMTTLPRK